ncbi:MAG: hypothetical protein PUB07_05515 [Clostridia bacterium]|nr:hypothetical protein [Clostridia bacterium]
MQHINRLLRIAKTAANGKGKRILGFVDYDPEKKKFTASGTIWDGVAGSGGEGFYSEHDTQEEAIAACEAVAAKYLNSENINIIIDDLPFPEGV